MEFWGQLLAAVGGALGITLIIMRMCKSFIVKWVETSIATTAEKSLAKYSDTLNRHTKAYEMILEKEFTFFECANKFTSAVFLGNEDAQHHLGLRKSKQVNFKLAEHQIKTILKKTVEFKRDILLANPYLPMSISAAASALIDFMDGEYVQAVEEILSDHDKLDENAKTKFNSIDSHLMYHCAFLNAKISDRVKELCE